MCCPGLVLVLFAAEILVQLRIALLLWSCRQIKKGLLRGHTEDSRKLRLPLALPEVDSLASACLR